MLARRSLRAFENENGDLQNTTPSPATLALAPYIDVKFVAGIDAEILDGGCCGMGGAFGFRREHAPVARAIGERHILPAVRAASAETLIVADGFSCREQISQETGRSPLHLVEILAIPDEIVSPSE